MSESVSDDRPVSILFAGSSDRSVVACARALEQSDIPFLIASPKNKRIDPWMFSKYREKIISNAYSLEGNIEELERELKDIREKVGNIIVFPTGRHIPQKLAYLRDNITDEKIIIPVPGVDKYRKLADKKKLMDLCNEYDISTPNINYNLPKSNNLPFVAKPMQNEDKDGNSLPVKIIESDSDYQKLKSETRLENYFYQDYISGESKYLCSAYSSGEIKTMFIQKNELQQPAGGSIVKASPGELPEEVITSFNEMIKDLDWDGVLMAEFRGDNDYYLIEINPRFWGPIQLPIDNGIDFPSTLYEIYTGRALKTDTSQSRKVGYKRYDGYVEGLWMYAYTRKGFQQWEETAGVIYNDVWLRRDSLLLFVIKIAFTVGMPLQYIINKAKSWFKK